MESFQYKILIVDNDNHSNPFILNTGKSIAVDLISKIDIALEKLGIPVEEYLDKGINQFDGDLCHEYDIVLLDFQMDENQLLNISGVLSYEYPMGAVSLQPLYILGFRNSGKIGNCVVQAYSKVMWEICPKAAALSYLINKQLTNNQFNMIVHEGDVSSVDINTLVKMRAESIIASLPFYALDDLRNLLNYKNNADRFMNSKLVRISNILNTDDISLARLRPDTDDIEDLVKWLEISLRGRGYAYEAMKCWSNDCVNYVAHSRPLANCPYSQPEPWKWPSGLSLKIEDPPFVYQVCAELLDDLRSFDVKLLNNSTERCKLLHRMFRLDLSSKATGALGYCISDVSALTQFDHVTLIGHADEPGRYVYAHRTCLAQMLNGIGEMVAGRTIDNALLVYANDTMPYVYFIAPQNHKDGYIAPLDADSIWNNLCAGAWGDLGKLVEMWGWIELWGTSSEDGNPLCYTISKHVCSGISANESVYNDNEILNNENIGNTQVVLVLPSKIIRAKKL